MSKTATCGSSGKRALGDLDPVRVGRVVQRREDREVADRGQHGVVDQHRRGEALAAVDDAVRDGTEVVDRRVASTLSSASAWSRTFWTVPDPSVLPDAGVDDRPLQRRGAAVDDEDLHCAWIAVIATVLTMSCTVAPRERSLTGLFRPCSTGPMAIAPALRWTAL